MNRNSENLDIEKIIRDEVRRAMRVQVLVQIGIQAFAYGTAIVGVWVLQEQIRDVLGQVQSHIEEVVKLVRNLSGAALDGAADQAEEAAEGLIDNIFNRDGDR